VDQIAAACVSLSDNDRDMVLQVVEAWPSLPGAIRKAIVAMVESAMNAD
jgi:hypothetical protein